MIREPRPRSARWLSTSIPEAQWQSSLARTSSAEYNVNNLVSPVLFQEALWHVPENAVLLEIAPHALLQVSTWSARGRGAAQQPASHWRGVWRAGGQSPAPLCHAQAVLKRGVKPSCTIIPLMKRDHKDNLEFFLTNLGKVHLTGYVPLLPAAPGGPFHPP